VAWTPEHEALAQDLTRIVEARVLGPVDILFGLDAALAGRAERAVRGWVEVLLGEDDGEAAATAIRLVATLYPEDGPFDPPHAWWGTPLGRAVLVRAGHPAATAVSYSVAAAMLGITRQGVHDLVRRGKLTLQDDGGGVTVDSVRERIKVRAETPARH
jgi:hypothetical protein